MASLKAITLRWTNRTLKFLIPKTPWGDRLYCSLHVWYMQKRLPRYRHPQTFSDHLFRLRAGVEADDAFRQQIADKILVKDYISKTIGSKYTLNTLSVLGTDEEIESFIPSQIPCVIKPSHASGRVIILRNAGDEIDKALMKKWLRLNYYDVNRERTYRNIRKRIIVEEMFSDDGLIPPDDYKVFCFRGMPKFIQVDSGRFTRHVRTLYTPAWRRIPIRFKYPQGPDFAAPEYLEEMLSVAGRLAAPLSFIRVDFLFAMGQLKVNELTNIPDAANSEFQPAAADLRLARLFTDPNSTVEQALEGLI